ncbi:GtrA family protein [Microbacterium sp. SMR1]|uniref:GtrA family protein n=1 Tax=Microbacterium sp. SMR1 TaxID=1497340 RepID=UPI0015EB9E36|nr:GtrA family protein [Microbacterium sp. SMR1]
MPSETSVPRSGGLHRIWSSSLVRYLVMGGLAFAFDVGLLALLHDVAGVPLAVATPTAFLASFVVTYTLQRLFAFRATDAVAPSVVRYALLVALNTALTTGIVASADALGWPWLAGKVIAVAVTTVGNYFAYRYWVFARPKGSSTHV